MIAYWARHWSCWNTCISFCRTKKTTRCQDNALPRPDLGNVLGWHSIAWGKQGFGGCAYATPNDDVSATEWFYLVNIFATKTSELGSQTMSMSVELGQVKRLSSPKIMLLLWGLITIDIVVSPIIARGTMLLSKVWSTAPHSSHLEPLSHGKISYWVERVVSEISVDRKCPNWH